MSSTLKVKASTIVPVVYWCSKCGKMNVALIKLDSESQESISDFAGKRKQAEKTADLYRNTHYDLKKKVADCYSRDPLARNDLIGKCSCGNVELWMTSPEEMKRSNLLGSLFAPIWCVATLIMAGFLADRMGMGLFVGIILWILIGLGGPILLARVWSKLFPQKEQKRQAAIDAIPPEHRPYFLQDQDHLKAGIDFKMEDAITEVWADIGEKYVPKRQGWNVDETLPHEEMVKAIPDRVLDYCETNAGDGEGMMKFLNTLVENRMITKAQRKYLMETYGWEK